MMPVTRTYTGTGVQVPIALDYMPQSDITAVFDPLAATATVAVEVSLDDVFDQDAPNYVPVASATWITVPGAPTAAKGFATFAGPWRAIRLNITANNGTVKFSVGQAVAGDY
jgi:hypothetical protein